MSDSDDTDIIVDESKFKTMRSFSNWPFIKDLLRKMADGMMNSDQIIQTLSKFKNISHKNRFGKKRICKNTEFDVLIDEYDDQIPQIFCQIATFVLKETSYEYPLFQKKINFEHTFAKEEVLFLLCSMVLQLIPKQQYHTQEKQRGYTYTLDFSLVFKSSQYKTKAIIEYIKREIKNQQSFKERLTIKRKIINSKLTEIIEQNKEIQMGKIAIKDNADSIQNYYGKVKVDFANKFIGGGALGHGCVQQQIMFANHPQLYISQLLCQAMQPNQALFFIGFKKCSKNIGYSINTKYGGAEDNSYEYDANLRAKQYILAIDALCFQANSLRQFKMGLVQREILKAYCGFSFNQTNQQSIVSGNWGCGAFGGNVQLKFIIQWIASTLSGKELIYCPFGSAQKLLNEELFKVLPIMKVGDVYNIVLKACTNILRDAFLFKKKYEEIDLFKTINDIIRQENYAESIQLSAHEEECIQTK